MSYTRFQTYITTLDTDTQCDKASLRRKIKIANPDCKTNSNGMVITQVDAVYGLLLYAMFDSMANGSKTKAKK